ncbi:MAG: DUF4198 domain-containing protein [Planctomycetia bacterium]|nr:DUF4198 domain-containing protein [Planctomycetia bacterium]
MHIRLSLFAAACVATVLFSGCSGPQMAAVRGKVTFNGQPVKEAAVTFSPAGAEGQKETGKPATGFTDENGEFVLSTFKNFDGAMVGEHRVFVMVDDTNPAKCKREKELTWTVKPGDNQVEIEMDKPDK